MVNSTSNKKEIKKGLYLVPTPIGNLGDITYRAVEVLKNYDFILCEDTRVSKNLLKKFNIKSKLISNHKFNEVSNLNKIVNLLKDSLEPPSSFLRSNFADGEVVPIPTLPS